MSDFGGFDPGRIVHFIAAVTLRDGSAAAADGRFAPSPGGEKSRTYSGSTSFPRQPLCAFAHQSFAALDGARRQTAAFLDIE
jgi:hypothetical protein